jgi:hypothetical protein
MIFRPWWTLHYLVTLIEITCAALVSALSLNEIVPEGVNAS